MHVNTASFRFVIKALEPIILPPYKGSTFRGGFGNAFKRIVCTLKNKECRDCILEEKCIYSYVFETPPPSDTKIMKRYTAAPHPFIIEPPPERKGVYKPGDEIEFGLILIGRAIDYLPYFIYTFDELGRIGIGKGKAKFDLQGVSCDGEKIYDSKSKTLKPFKTSSLLLEDLFQKKEGIYKNVIARSPDKHRNDEAISLSFLTPTRILFNGHLTLDLEFHILIRHLLRRLALLYYFHCNGDTSEWDFKGMIEKAKDIKVTKSGLKWHDWERYSARQDARIKMGGFIGEITFEGNIEPFMQLIKVGEILHVGKGTAFGLGKYVIMDNK